MARILVYDRNFTRQKLCAEQLEDHEVIGCANLQQALRFVAESRPDLLLVEWFDSDGNKFLNELERLPGPKPPVILMGRLDKPEQALRATRAACKSGAHTFLAYPATEDQLRRSIEIVLGRQQAGFDDGFVMPDLARIEAEEKLDDEAVALLMRGAVMYDLAELVGGVDKLTELIRRHGVHTQPERQRQLFTMLNNWGELGHAQRITAAIEFVTVMGKVKDDPISATIHDIAEEIISGDLIASRGLND